MKRAPRTSIIPPATLLRLRLRLEDGFRQAHHAKRIFAR
jgi:hypothetical protein